MEATETMLAGLSSEERIRTVEGHLEACRTAWTAMLHRGSHATCLEIEAAMRFWQGRLYVLKGGRVA